MNEWNFFEIIGCFGFQQVHLLSTEHVNQDVYTQELQDFERNIAAMCNLLQCF